MQRKRGNRTKEIYGTSIKRSEYDDDLLRNNTRTGNRLKTEMQYQDRAQRVIMKDLGKEALLLRNKLENDRKTLTLGLYGSRFGTTSPNTRRKVKPTNSLRPLYPSFLQKMESKATNPNARWSKNVDDVVSATERRSVNSSQISRTPVRLANTSGGVRYKTPTAVSFPSYSAQKDEFLSSILNDQNNDYFLSTESRSGQNSPRKLETPRTPRGYSMVITPRGKVTPPKSPRELTNIPTS